MSTHQVTLRPISEVAAFLKELLPAAIPDAYALKPIFENVASEEKICNGVIAFKNFLHLFFDRLISDGHLYAKPPKKPRSMTDYPFLGNVSQLLFEIGYYSKLIENGNALLITKLPSCSAPNPKIPASKQVECLRFLTLCGFVFDGNISENQPLEVSYPNNSIMLTGLKALSIADAELRPRRFWGDHNLLRCDYRLLKAEDTDMLDVVKDFLHPLPGKVQDFALKLHQRYVDMGMTCSMRVLGDVNISYADISKSRKVLSPTDIYSLSVWQFSVSMKNGYCLFVRPKKTEKYSEDIKKFPLYLREKIAKGYGCDRKRNEHCQGGCQGICIPLDESILSIAKDIEIWLDNEMPKSLRK
jgi:hypothetical protein